MEEGSNVNIVDTRVDENKDLTQVTTLQQQALVQGNVVPQQLDQAKFETQLMLDHQYGSLAASGAFNQLSRKGMIRVFNSILALPQEGLEVKLNGKLEREIYLAAQKTIYAKSAIVFNRLKKEKMAEEVALTKKNEGIKNEESSKTKSEEENQTLGSDR